MGGGEPGDEQQVATWRDEMLLVTENFPQPTLRSITKDGATHGFARCDHTDAGGKIGGNFCRCGAFFPPNREGPALNPSTLLAHGADFLLAAQVLVG